MSFLLRKFRFIIGLIFIILILTRFPARKILISPVSNGKCITVFRPFQLRWQNKYYITPSDFKGIFKPRSNYFILTPLTADQDMIVDWDPSNYKLPIQLPFCEDVQKVIYNIDTINYHIAKFCGNNTKYIDDLDSGPDNSKRFSYYSVREWVP